MQPQRITRLSLAAIRMAARLGAESPAQVATWLYRFGTAPRDTSIDRAFGAGDEPMAILRLGPGASVRRRLERSHQAAASPGWYSFAHAAPAVGPPLCKLYVSPTPAALADAFPCIVDQFVEHRVRAFKVGRGVAGLLRPDKIVAYFDSFEHLFQVAGALETSLRGCGAQGVPFTCELGGDGLLSSGVDPHSDTTMSWRGWVTEQLAASLIASRRRGYEPVDAALAHIRRVGVDPTWWRPVGAAFTPEVAHV